MTTEDKFYAAVKVIRGLPKHGSYQPSNQLMLKFYAFYKQATEGPCQLPKPGFWDLIGRAKWEAWKTLGNMPKEEAMVSYIEELKKIVETMSYTENVAQFMDVLGPFYEILDIPQDTMSEPGLPNERNEVQPTKNEDIIGLPNGKAVAVDESGDHAEDDLTTDIKNVHPVIVKDSHAEKFYSDTDSDDEFADPVELQVEELPVKKKYYSDNANPLMSDNDSGFADHMEHVAAQYNSNNDRILIEDKHNQLWAFFPSKSSEPPSPERQEFYVNGHAGMVSNGYDTDYSRLNGDENIEPREVLSGDSPVKGLTARGGGDEDRGGGGPAGQRRSSPAQDGRNRNRDNLNHPDAGNPGRGGAGNPGLGGNGRGNPGGFGPPRYSVNINEQIAVALLRLQRDMDSVLSRLNVLETVTLAQHNTNQERLTNQFSTQPVVRNSSPSWWPFKDLSFRTFLFFLAWPVILQIILKILAKRQARYLRTRANMSANNCAIDGHNLDNPQFLSSLFSKAVAAIMRI